VNDLSNFHAWKGVRPFKRHSLVLAVAGLVFIAIGGSYLFAEPTNSRVIALSVAIAWLPLEGWGVVFVFSGILAIISSRWPPISETWGYTVLTGLSAAWAAFYAMGVIFDNSPAANLSGTLSWGLIAFMWWAISGLTNPDPRPEVVYERDHDS
jgi:hypothetical protein